MYTVRTAYMLRVDEYMFRVKEYRLCTCLGWMSTCASGPCGRCPDSVHLVYLFGVRKYIAYMLESKSTGCVHV